MAFFDGPDELYEYIGTILRAARDHPQVGPLLAAAGIVVQLRYTDPDASLTVRLQQPMVIEEGGVDPDADVVFSLPADLADRYWRGEYNLAVGLSSGKVQATGDVQRVLDLLPAFKPLFPTYRELVADKDRAMRRRGLT
jgi:hypothetical protein